MDTRTSDFKKKYSTTVAEDLSASQPGEETATTCQYDYCPFVLDVPTQAIVTQPTSQDRSWEAIKGMRQKADYEKMVVEILASNPDEPNAGATPPENFSDHALFVFREHPFWTGRPPTCVKY